MNCPLLSEQTADILLDYAAGRLSVAGTSALEKHKLVCSRCAAFMAGQREVWLALDAWDPPPVSTGFNRQLRHRVDKATSAAWWSFHTWKPAFTLAAAMLVIVAGFVFDHQRIDTRRPVPAVSGGTEVSGVSIGEVDQMERTLDDIQLLRQFDAAAAVSRPL